VPWNAIPVGKFRPVAKTDTLNPGGRTMSSPLLGLNKAVLSGQRGFATVAAGVMVGSIRNSASAPMRLRV
jgi:hypothetical protein